MAVAVSVLFNARAQAAAHDGPLAHVTAHAAFKTRVLRGLGWIVLGACVRVFKCARAHAHVQRRRGWVQVRSIEALYPGGLVGFSGVDAT